MLFLFLFRDCKGLIDSLYIIVGWFWKDGKVIYESWCDYMIRWNRFWNRVVIRDKGGYFSDK